MIIQHLYDTAPKVVQAQVDALLGRGARRTSPDADKPWKDAQARADAVPDTAEQRMAEMEAADLTPNIGSIEVGILRNATDGPLWDQDEQASLVEGMKE